MSDAIESLIRNAIILRLSNTPDPEGGPQPNLEWIGPAKSVHIAKAILQDLASSGYQVVKATPTSIALAVLSR